MALNMPNEIALKAQTFTIIFYTLEANLIISLAPSNGQKVSASFIAFLRENISIQEAKGEKKGLRFDHKYPL